MLINAALGSVDVNQSEGLALIGGGAWLMLIYTLLGVAYANMEPARRLLC